MGTLTLLKFKGYRHQFAEFFRHTGEEFFGDYVEELDSFITNELNTINWEVYLSPREQYFMEDDFIIWAAETGRDREACFDYEEEHHKFITDTLQTEKWRME